MINDVLGNKLLDFIFEHTPGHSQELILNQEIINHFLINNIINYQIKIKILSFITLDPQCQYQSVLILLKPTSIHENPHIKYLIINQLHFTQYKLIPVQVQLSFKIIFLLLLSL
jgi:hypothetical protein